MPLSEADTRAKLIDPTLHERGWHEDLIKRERLVGPAFGEPKRRGYCDYVLCFEPPPAKARLAFAIVEAKAEDEAPTFGLGQAKDYAKRLQIKFAFATNGHLFTEHDFFTGLTSEPRALSQFPAPADLRTRYEAGLKIDLNSKLGQPLFEPYHDGESHRRYYQDAAIRATLEKIARGDNRALLALATGAGKTFLVCELLHKLASAGHVTHALFVCDRTELAKQANGALFNVFGGEVGLVTGKDAQKNARILVATYQTLDIGGDPDSDAKDDATFLVKNYPENYFSHIVIDECHRSAWGKWSVVLKRNPNAVQIGLTATPRTLTVDASEADADAVKVDREITANNVQYFGEPAYEYTVTQGQEDGFLATCHVTKRDVHVLGEERLQVILDGRLDVTKYLTREVVSAHNPVYVTTGALAEPTDIKNQYGAASYGARLVISERAKAMCDDLFEQFVAGDGPFQRSIIFCASDREADEVAIYLNNLLVLRGFPKTEDYAFKCTASSYEEATDLITKLKKSAKTHFIATTVDLLSTGVDVPRLQNIVFFRHLKSPILFYQMLGRGTRLDAETGKVMFRLYDYTDATRLFGREFKVKPVPPRAAGEGDGARSTPTPPIQISGFTVQVNDAGRFVVMDRGGRDVLVPQEEFESMVAEKVISLAHSLDELREQWITARTREALLAELPNHKQAALLLRALRELEPCDLYDVLGDLAFGVAPKSRVARVDAFGYKAKGWLASMHPDAAATIRTIATFFGNEGGIEEVDSPMVFKMPQVKKTGGLKALESLSIEAADVLRLIKERLLAA